MSRRDGPVLVVGVGNVLLRDEGVGVRVACEIQERVNVRPWADDVRVIDGGTLGLDLLPLIEDCRALLIADAVELGAAPGTTRVIRGPAIHGTLAGHVSPHQVGVGDLVAAARLVGQLPEDTTLIGIQPGLIEIGLELSEPVEAAVPTAVDLVDRELRRLVAQPAAVA